MEDLDPLVQAIDAEVAAMTARQHLVGCPRNWTGRGKVKAAGEQLEQAGRKIVAARFCDDGTKDTREQLRSATKAFRVAKRELERTKKYTDRTPKKRAKGKSRRKYAPISSAAFWGK